MNDAKSNPWAEIKRLNAENANLHFLIEQANGAMAELRNQLAATEKAAEERLHRLMDEKRISSNLSDQLSATEEALAQVQRESAKLRDEYRWLCGYPGTAAMAVCEAAVAVDIVNKTISRIIRRNEFLGLTASLLVSAEVATLDTMKKAVADYREQVRGHDTAPERLKGRFRRTADTPAEPSDVDEKEDGLGFFPGFSPGFDVKRAEKGLAQEGGDSTAWQGEAEPA